jgi:dipeptidase D
MSTLSALDPQKLWSVFEELSLIPRPSGHEEAALQLLEKRLAACGVKHWRDGAGNLLMQKAASKGLENAMGVVLQSHIDMVPQKSKDSDHNFETDGLKLQVQDGWVSATDTTLGADNGIGVAAIMGVMESKDIAHGPLEGLITIDEERGLVGAKNLERGKLKGSILLNLDSEDEGELFVGCAGGADLEVSFEYETGEIPPGLVLYKMNISGLTGGHSGLDIHLGRGNAIQILSRFLSKQMSRLKLGLVSFDGGTLLNAIPREATIVVGLPKRFGEEFVEAFDGFRAELSTQYSETDPHLTLAFERQDHLPQRMMTQGCSKRLLTALRSCPSHTLRMSPTAKGVSETSNNLAVIRTERGRVNVTCMVRSLNKDAQDDALNQITDLFKLAGADTRKGVSFSGWMPNMNSKVLKTAQDSYQAIFNKEAKINVIHAGLECGLLGEAYPNWDMISFGPTIKDAHSPDERVHIESVQRFWTYLLHMLKTLGTEVSSV